ncbi:MAG: CpsD/CapB family tyrosine-protein kinase [Gracilimonas sp.]|uniref:CpsD/CapB family tyrosine-protein kinase n=1 Tax=Gracilimonas sp. TaxID=1974203 RepID=UPI0019C22E19|nr:CpsD/CapB family tyrosine-protein kinase [Gracilimonas sp.]MBD3615424.1 CpsD/CapB family tyrosine-protein kinase [Gracilimonas sp.]
MDPNNKKEKGTGLVPVAKSIVVNSDQGGLISRDIVKKQVYNALNYTMLPEQYQNMDLTIGVTSPGKGEGKTMTASNLAVSFALAYKKKTVLVDMNMENPNLHKVFGTDLAPGLVESFENGSVFLSRTRLDQLYLLPAGRHQNFNMDLENITVLRDIIYSLKQEFQIVILDMNSIFPVDDFPAVFANEVDGLLVVIDTKKTKYAEVEKIFRHINKDQTMGFVFNRVDKN